MTNTDLIWYTYSVQSALFNMKETVKIETKHTGGEIEIKNIDGNAMEN